MTWGGKYVIVLIPWRILFTWNIYHLCIFFLGKCVQCLCVRRADLVYFSFKVLKFLLGIILDLIWEEVSFKSSVKIPKQGFGGQHLWIFSPTWFWITIFLFICLFGVYRPTQNFSLIWRRHYCRWRAANFLPLLGTHGHWAMRVL